MVIMYQLQHTSQNKGAHALCIDTLQHALQNKGGIAKLYSLEYTSQNHVCKAIVITMQHISQNKGGMATVYMLQYVTK